mgnify:CR=1 FL=1
MATSSTSMNGETVKPDSYTFFSVIENKAPYKIIETDIETVERARAILAKCSQSDRTSKCFAIRKEAIFN